MSAALIGGRIAVPAVAQDLVTLLKLAGGILPPAGASGEVYSTVGNIVLRAGKNNVGITYIGPSSSLTATSGNRIGYLQAGEAFAITLLVMRFHIDQIFIVGTPGDEVFVAGVEF